MKKLLTKEEKQLLKSYEADEWKQVSEGKSERQRYQGYARATFKKDRRINIRISVPDLEGVQKRAIEEGIPYQTLISSVIHKYVNGVLADRRA